MLDLHHKRPLLSRTEKIIYVKKLRDNLNISKVMWKIGIIIWIIQAKNPNEVKGFLQLDLSRSVFYFY